MNTVQLTKNDNIAQLKLVKNSVELKLVDVQTVNYGFIGMQQYEGVEPIATDNKER